MNKLTVPPINETTDWLANQHQAEMDAGNEWSHYGRALAEIKYLRAQLAFLSSAGRKRAK